MPHELSIGGVFVPGPLVLLVLLLPLFVLLDWVFMRIGLYRRALHPSLIRIALFAIVYSVAVLLLF